MPVHRLSRLDACALPCASHYRSCAATGWWESSTPIADRKAGVLRVDAIHQDLPFDPVTTAAMDGEIKDLAHWRQPDLALCS